MVNIENLNLEFKNEDICFSAEEIANRNLVDINFNEIIRKLSYISTSYYIKEIHIHTYKEIKNGKSTLIRPEHRYDALPLYRQEENMRINGIELSRQTMSNAIMKTS